MTRGDNASRSTESQGRQDLRSGHAVHWIQAKNAAEHRHEAEAGRIVAVTAQGVVVKADGRRRRYAVDDPAGIRELIGR